MQLVKATFKDLPEFRCAHETNFEALTGCTIFIADDPEGFVCGVDVRGGAPATRETDLLRPENTVQRANAVMLSGGSAFGLASACGAMDELSKVGYGFKLASACVPIVPAACLFDLLVGQPVWPDANAGADACKRALSQEAGTDLECGSVGAGCGCTVGKMALPDQASKSGFGWAGARMGDLVVISCAAVNALGNIMDEHGKFVSGVNGPDGTILDPFEAAAAHIAQASYERTNTTLGIVLANASFDKAQATKVCQMAQDGFARSIYPSHTPNDGDAVFCMASGRVDCSVDIVGAIAAETMAQAVRVGATSALSQ